MKSRSSAVLPLLLVSVWINYMDRGNLSVAAPAIGAEMGFDAAQLGALLSCFFWTYTALQPLAGWLVDRYHAPRIYAAGFALWSMAVAAGGLAGGLAGLMASRLALGVGEAVAYPVYGRILAATVPENRRGLANAMIDIGTKAGPALGGLLGGLLIPVWGWRGFFALLGLAALLWLPPWLYCTGRATVGLPAEPGGSSVREILKLRQAWATFFGLFCFNYAFYFLLTWLPSYLVSERHFPLRAVTIANAGPYCATAAVSLLTAWYADRRIRRGAGVSETRKPLAIGGLLLCAVALPAAGMLPNVTLAMAALTVAFCAIGMFTANVWAMTQTLAGAGAAGTWTGLQNAVGSLGGVTAPLVTGWIVRETGSFQMPFLIAAGLLAASAVFYGPVLGRVAPAAALSPASVSVLSGMPSRR